MTTGCPACSLGRLVKHCEPNDRCGWWECDRSCGQRPMIGGRTGYRIDLTSGREFWPDRAGVTVRDKSEGPQETPQESR